MPISSVRDCVSFFQPVSMFAGAFQYLLLHFEFFPRYQVQPG